jgi:hypothetical protein
VVPLISSLAVADDPQAWREAGFRVDEAGCCRVGRVRLDIAPSEAEAGVTAWALSGVDDAGVIDGLPTVDATTEPPAEGADAHPNGVLSIDHLVVVTPDLARTVGALQLFGLEPRRTREAGTAERPMRQTFFRSGEVIVEVVGPAEPRGDGPARFYGLAFTVADLDTTADVLGERVGRVKDAVQPGRRIATLRSRDLGMTTSVAFLSPETRRPGRT